MKNGKQTPRLLPTSLTESGREARREARGNGTLRGGWERAIGDLRGLLTSAKHGEDVEENLDLARAILKHLRLIVHDRVRHACSCQGSQTVEQSLARLHARLFGAMSDLLLAAAIAESAWGRGNPLTGQIASALRQVPTLAEIGKLAPELGYVPVADVTPEPMVRQGAPTRCRFCGL